MMGIIDLRPTNETPKVILNSEKEIFEISGVSLPEDVKEFYVPLINWFKEYFENPNNETILKIKFLYINTASSKMIFEIFQIFKFAHKAGINVKIHWQYNSEDEEMGDAGEDFAILLEGVPFHIEGITMH